MNTTPKKQSPERSSLVAPEMQEMFGDGMSFAAKEAYKLLRTNLLFALSDAEEGRGHIIGVTSSLRGEGKSTTAINLAATLAELNKKVLIIDADLRIPSVHKKLRVRSKPGVSNVIVARTSPEPYIQPFRVKMLEGKPIIIDVLAAGAIPPNPSELLGSNRMKAMVEHLAGLYDYIVLDLPPITAVTDALVATKLMDGMVMVVRNDYSDRSSLNEAIRQIQLVDGKILGFVFTCANTASGGYGKKYKYRYYNRYYKYKDYK